MRPLSKVFYFLPIFFGWMVSFAAISFLAFVFMQGRGRDREIVPLLLIPAVIPAMLGVGIPTMVFVYKAWASIQDATPRTTPLAAVLLLFVPFFNLCWMFQAYWGWTKDFNRIALKQETRVYRAPEGIALTICVLILLSVIPVIGSVFALANQVLTLVFLNAGIDSINSLIEARSQLAMRKN